MRNNKISVALVDDHVMLRRGLSAMVEGFGYSVILECSNGRELIEKLNKDYLPDVVLMDINMPQMDGFETTLWLGNNYPFVRVLALSMYDEENAIIRIIKNGAKGYILKESEPSELRQAIDTVMATGFYYSETISGKVIRSIQRLESVSQLNQRQIEFLKFVCTELTYKEIADKMCVSPRTVDGYRDDLFEKLGIKSRVGLVLFAIKNRIVHIN